ncbi:MAG: hypothetical protein AVDCRST_MAG79-1912 [uncultured Thermoleophilia bacterium]|uniref:Uncharacterized protein n=1 Tax=uncultured Thermoleophilia bacterium TaxID=1497501 RepID=A0A6J4U8L9_9ACTN|nr:MAG: hypothetical protein AVDCRST_MAG79-1912 [uncultured Thermoleophilia bacterium]
MRRGRRHRPRSAGRLRAARRVSGGRSPAHPVAARALGARAGRRGPLHKAIADRLVIAQHAVQST